MGEIPLKTWEILKLALEENGPVGEEVRDKGEQSGRNTSASHKGQPPWRDLGEPPSAPLPQETSKEQFEQAVNP